MLILFRSLCLKRISQKLSRLCGSDIQRPAGSCAVQSQALPQRRFCGSWDTSAVNIERQSIGRFPWAHSRAVLSQSFSRIRSKLPSSSSFSVSSRLKDSTNTALSFKGISFDNYVLANSKAPNLAKNRPNRKISVNSHRAYPLLTVTAQNDILFLTELDTPLNNAYHVESF